MSTVRVILAAGGTGGHVFPAIGLAEALSKRGHSVLCLTDTRAIDLPLRMNLKTSTERVATEDL